jgi:hypothetical protein
MDNGIKNLAMKWVLDIDPAIFSENYYCATRDVFQARIDNMIKEMMAVIEI